MALSNAQLERFWADGHVTVPDVFSQAEMNAANADIDAWGEEFMAGMDAAQRAWYLEQGGAQGPILRKLDSPVTERALFRELAAKPALVAMVEALIGKGVGVYFSQLFLKPARHGGPKPMHQDNYYAGPNDPDGLVTAWIALDEATVENGCLYFGDGSHKRPLLPHFAPDGKPFDLQVVEEVARQQEMTPAPVPRGGVSFHHGGVLHQSSDNRSDRPRRAAAVTYVNRHTRFASPNLDYDEDRLLWVS